MRTQEEILKKVRQIRASGTDPANVQIRTLIHKLEWKNALQFYPPNRRTEEIRIRFETMNSLEEEHLVYEVTEQIDKLFMFVSDGDAIKIHLHLQLIMAYMWLLRKEELVQWIYKRLSWHNMNYRAVARFIAEEMKIEWRVLELRYT